jgi:hypothetical protein
MATVVVSNTGWNNVTISMNGKTYALIKSISYNHKQKKENLYGLGKEPVGRGLGQVDYEGGEVELYLEAWKDIIANSPNRDPLAIPPFTIAVTYGDTAAALQKDLLTACEFTEDALSVKQGDTHITVKVPFVYAGISR